MLRRIFQFLNQPYPDQDDLRSLIKGALYGGLVVFGILWLLEPFGLHLVDNSWLYAGLFGLISAAVALALELLIVYGFGIRRDQPSWTLWKWLLTTCVLVLLIAVANYLFVSWMGDHTYDWAVFKRVLSSTLAVGIFPIILFGSTNLVRYARLNQMTAAAIDQQELPQMAGQELRIPVLKSDRFFAVHSTEVLYIEAMQNYVCIHYLEQGGLKKEVIRNTLAALVDLLSDTTIVRCHRSYLVNHARVEKVSGNAQGLQLHLSGLAEGQIPVSRKYIPVFKQTS